MMQDKLVSRGTWVWEKMRERKRERAKKGDKTLKIAPSDKNRT